MSPTPSTPAPDAQGSTLDVMADRLFQRGLGLSRGYARGVVEHILTGDPDASPERKAAALSRLAPAAEASGLADAVRPFIRELRRLEPNGRDESIGDSCQLWQIGPPEISRTRLTYGDLRALDAALSAQTGGADAAAGGDQSEVDTAYAGPVKLLPCPFCRSTKVDPEGWLPISRKGPVCDDCGGSAETVELWNRHPRTPASGVDAPVVGNMVLVPREPTPEMCEAGDLHELMLPSAPYDRLNAIWSAMLDAASSASHPTAPEQSGEATEMVGRPASPPRSSAAR